MNDTTWHVDDEQLGAYAAGRLDDVRSSSAEAHLVTCNPCRARLSGHVDAARIAHVWADVVDAVDRPPVGIVERALRAMGMKEANARLLAATPSLQLSWLLAVTLALAFSVLAAQASRNQSVALFLVVAPLLPLAGVAAAFSPSVDASQELVATTPMAGFRLLLLRASAVFVVTFALVGVASLALPRLDVTDAAWMLPALGLTVVSLALATVLPVEHAALGVAGAWMFAVTAAAQRADDWLAPFGPAGQLTSVAVIAVATIVVVCRRHLLEVPCR